MSPNDRPPSTPGAFGLEELSIAELQQAMSSGAQSASSLTQQYLDRIRAIDSGGPGLNAVIELNPDAVDIAAVLDRERHEHGPRGPLHGIPLLIKDNIDTSDGMMTTAGSLALVGWRPPRDAHLIERLRAAGAIILGKTNLSEWANIRSTNSTSGWSARGGLTRNPYALDRNTSGSSSGSAAAVSANLCAAAIGTETDGSIVSPSSCCGIIGIKPTVGLVSRRGVIPIAHSQDTAGPMARSVADAAALLAALAGGDPEDPATDGLPKGLRDELAHPVSLERLDGRRIGVVRSAFGYHREVDRIAEEAIALVKELGAKVVDPVALPTIATIDEAEFTLLQYELKADLNAYLSRLGPELRVHSLAEVIEYNRAHAEREMPYFGQEIFELAQARGGLSDRDYLDAQEACRQATRGEGIDALMERERLDALLAPTGAPAWLTDLVDGDHYLGGSAQAAAVAGYPSITVPAGFASGLPVGISFFGRAWSEPLLLSIAAAFERASAVRRPPTFPSTVTPVTG